MSLSNKDNIPINYQQVEYIESSGTQYIDTGVIIKDSNIDIDIKFNSIDNGKNYQAIFGGRVASNAQGFTYFNKDGGTKNRTIYQRNYEVKTLIHFNIYNVDLHLTTNGATLTISDGVNSQILTNDTTFNNGNKTLYLFSNNDYDKLTSASSTKIYYCKIYQDGALIRDFIPCYRKSDGVAGMYDKVSKEFMTNKGTGDFEIAEE